MTPPTLKITWIKWDKGDTWESIQGIQGIQWEKWEQGIQGEVWPIWPKWDKGDKGDKGDNGLDWLDWISPVLDYEKIVKKLPKEDITPKIISEIKKLNKDIESKGLDVRDLKGGKELIKEVKHISQFWQISTEYRVNGTKVADGNNLNLKAGNGVTLSWVPTSNGAEITITNSQSGAVWWQITGALADQTDLQAALDTKLESVVAWANITVDNTDPLNPIVSASSSASLTYMFANIASDISTYLQAVSLNSYVVNPTTGDQSGTATTSGVIIGRFATNLGFPNVTLIPAGTITIHYDTQKVAGSNNYYSRADIYKRNLAGTETLIATSDNSPSSALNTQQNITVTAVLASDVTMLSTDRLVVKVVVTMLSSTATVHVYSDDSTSARIELPTAQIDATNYVTISTDQNVTGTKTLLKTALASTTTDGWVMSNTTAAVTGSRIQVSPAIRRRWYGWNSGGSASQSIDFRDYVLPETWASGAHGYWVMQGSRNGASFVDLFTLKTTGEILQTVQSGMWAVTGLEINAPFANSTPGTTRHVRLKNGSGVGFIDWTNTSDIIKGSIGVEIGNGDMNFYSSTGRSFYFYNNPTSPSLYAQIYGGWIYNNGGSFNGGRLTAGSANTSPPTTFSNYGSTSLKTTILTTNTTLTYDYTQVIVDCSSNNLCTGTPSVTTCSSYTASGQAICESHLPCTWNAGTSCSIYDNEYGMGSCSWQGWCTVVTSACTWWDETSCLANDDAYGGSCTWTEGFASCSAFDGNEATCIATSGCTPQYGDCSAYSDGGGDGAACYAAYGGACSYDSGSGACTGTPYLNSCTGSYSTGFACGGNYNTGSCSGTFGTSCDGTATCGWYGTEVDCEAEAWCNWTSGVTITLPSSPVEQTYWIAKDYTSGTLTILPNSGDTVNNTSSITSSSTAWPWWMLTYVASKLNWYIMSKN